MVDCLALSGASILSPQRLRNITEDRVERTQEAEGRVNAVEQSSGSYTLEFMAAVTSPVQGWVCQFPTIKKRGACNASLLPGDL